MALENYGPNFFVSGGEVSSSSSKSNWVCKLSTNIAKNPLCHCCCNDGEYTGTHCSLHHLIFSHACKFDGSTVWRFWAQIWWTFARTAAQETSAFQVLAPSIIMGQHSQSHFSPTKLYLCLLLQKLQIHTFYFLSFYLSSQRCTSEYKKLHPKSNLLLWL